MEKSENRMFRAFFEQTLTPICVIKANPPEFTIVAINEQYKRTTTTNLDDAIGKSAFEVYQPYDEGSKKQFLLLMEGLTTCSYERRPVYLPILSFTKTVTDLNSAITSYWQIEINPIFDEYKNMEYLICIVRNITEQEVNRLSFEGAVIKEKVLMAELKAVNKKLTETVGELGQSKEDLFQLNRELETRVELRTRELTVSQNKFQSILDTIPQIAWTHNVKGESPYYNKRWYDYTGLSYGTANELSWMEFIHPDDLDHNAKSYAAILASNHPGQFETREKRKDGVYRWHLVKVEPFKNNEDEIELWIGTGTDIQELKELQQEKDDFISIASHELRTPLTTLKATLQLLEQFKRKPAHALLPKLIEQANKSMDKTDHLLDNLLNAGRLNKGEFVINKTTFVISEMLSNCSANLAVVGGYEFVIQGNRQLKANADEHQIEQVVMNFLNNAVKYAPESKRILLNVKKTQNAVKICVKDSGHGLSPEKLPLVFDRYYRAEHSGKRYSGMGLGLYICSEIIRRHGGEIGVNSEVGEGCEFWFTLPA
jgi:PAS domain S-box-containing protein